MTVAAWKKKESEKMLNAFSIEAYVFVVMSLFSDIFSLTLLTKLVIVKLKLFQSSN